MGKVLSVLIIILILVAGGSALFYFYGNKIGLDGTDRNGGNERQLQKGLTVLTPKSEEMIFSPLKISGYANGDGWAPFEAQAGTVELLDDQGKQLGFSILTTPGDWMQLPSYFETTLEFATQRESRGTLVFKNENASGLPENEREFRLSVNIPAVETMKVKVYFNNSKLDPEYSCNKVFPVEREVAKTSAVARASLDQLLKGLNQEETSQGFFTSINSGVKIQSLSIENGVAKVDFNDILEVGVGGSCRVSAIRAQIMQTLKQFPSVKNVIISVNGRTEDILQP